MFRNLPIRIRLMLGFGVVLGMTALIATISIARLRLLDSEIDGIVHREWVKSQLVINLSNRTKDNAIAHLQLFLDPTPQAFERTRDISATLGKGNTEDGNRLTELLDADDQQRLATIKQARSRYLPSLAAAVKLLQDGKRDEAIHTMTDETLGLLRAYVGLQSDMITHQAAILERTGEQASATYRGARTLTIVLGLLAVLAGAICAFSITRSITRPVARAVDAASRLADGDLSVELATTSRDEVGQLLTAMGGMVERLREVAVGVSHAAASVTTGAGHMNATAQQLAAGATEQGASTEQSTAAMEQMAASVAHNADSAQATDRLAAKAASDAQSSSETVARTRDAMKHIADKIAIIEEIARKTDLLALNAAVEAARAGDHGRGFAVVASEVRKLAERSGTAAAEIRQLSRDGVALAEHAGEALGRLVPDIRRTAELVQEVAVASREQNAGIEQTNRALQELDRVTQQNAAAAEQLAATAGELSGQAQDLQTAVAFFQLGDAPAPAPSAPPRRAPPRAAAHRPAPRPAPRTAPDNPRGTPPTGVATLRAARDDEPTAS